MNTDRKTIDDLIREDLERERAIREARPTLDRLISEDEERLSKEANR
jgi:hypothetical protein